MKKPITKRATGHVVAALREEGKGRKYYQRSSIRLAAAIAAGAPINEPITLETGEIVFIADHAEELRGKDALYRPARLPRFEIRDWPKRRPLPPGPAAQPAPESEASQ